MSQFDPTQPFTFKAGRAAGISRRALEGRDYRKLFFGVYVLASVADTPALRANAALLVAGPRARASHLTAARVRGVPIPTIPGEHVVVPEHAARIKREGIRSHVDRGGGAHLIDGVRVSTPEVLFVELAGHLSLVDLVIAGDHMVRRCGLTVARLRRHLRFATGPHADHARRAGSFVRARVDSPMETRLRMLIVLAGLPEPEVNPSLLDAHGSSRRYDLVWHQVKLIVEYDGRHHVEREEQWEADLDRREAIDDDGWRILVVVATGIFKDPERTLTRVHRALRTRSLPGLPDHLRDDWRDHFPVRSAA